MINYLVSFFNFTADLKALTKKFLTET